MSRVAVVSFRLNLSDGVSIEAAKWIGALRQLGHEVTTVAGEGPVDVVLPGLALHASVAPRADALREALEDADVVLVENLASLPLNVAAREVLYDVLDGRDALFHHHDLPWQRAHLAHLEGPRDAPTWRHVTINELSRRELAERGVEAVTIYNHFDCAPPEGRRARTRADLGLDRETLVVLPTRALARKNVGAALKLCEALDAVFWLLGPAEDGYDDALDELLSATSAPYRRGLPAGVNVHDAYAASDLVVMPSTWEGFGNPTIESVTHRRALALYPYPVAAELRAMGFHFFDLGDHDALRDFLRHGNEALLEANLRVARERLNLDDLPRVLDQHWRSWGFA
ncbi:MAG: glycosyltransferase family 4 protein [Acidobacteriota bacterium]|nr:glycosyltransferase family 4 protein [Acidobacteriota bacterium]